MVVLGEQEPVKIIFVFTLFVVVERKTGVDVDHRLARLVAGVVGVLGDRLLHFID